MPCWECALIVTVMVFAIPAALKLCCKSTHFSERMLLPLTLYWPLARWRSFSLLFMLPHINGCLNNFFAQSEIGEILASLVFLKFSQCREVSLGDFRVFVCKLAFLWLFTNIQHNAFLKFGGWILTEMLKQEYHRFCCDLVVWVWLVRIFRGWLMAGSSKYSPLSVGDCFD